MIVEICDGWQLRPHDSLNWQLWQRTIVPTNNITVGNGTAGNIVWKPFGRFYQASAFHIAIDFVADHKIRNEQPDEVISLAGYINQLKAFREAAVSNQF